MSTDFADDHQETLTSVHVHRAVAGNAASLAWIVQRFTPLLLAQADLRLGAVLRRHVDPEDLVADVWNVVLRRIGDLEAAEGRGAGAFVRYLGTTLLRRIRDLARLAAVRESGRRLAAGEPTEEDGAAAGPADKDDVVASIIRSERRSSVRDALTTLPEQDREVLVLRGLEERPLEEVGLLIGCKPGTVAVRYHRALKRLRTQLPGSVYDEFAED
jgi:RNA polymerase sigma-70 factor (ECF subfamily)